MAAREVGRAEHQAQEPRRDDPADRPRSLPAPWGGEEHYQGRALFKAPGLAWIDFRKVVDPKQPNPKTVAHERIVCTGQEVWQYRSDTQQIFIFPLEHDAQKRALAQGPLPFLFNFRADDAKGATT